MGDILEIGRFSQAQVSQFVPAGRSGEVADRGHIGTTQRLRRKLIARGICSAGESITSDLTEPRWLQLHDVGDDDWSR
jgi:hypothetical protein